MTSEEKKHLIGVLKPYLKEKGFRKKGGNWWRHTDDYIQVINIQGSQWSLNFYINLGVYVRALGDKEWPTEYQCHLRTRLESLYDNSKEILDLLNYHDSQPEERERGNLLSMLGQRGLPWLDKCSTYEGAKEESNIPGRVISLHFRKALQEYFA